MRDIGKLALRLFLFAFVAAAALGVTNEVTKGPIEQQKIAAKQEALGTVFPGCTFEQIDFSGFDTSDTVLEELFVAKDESGETVGYALTASPQGYGGPIPLTVGVSVEGYITYIYVGALQETAGLGTRVGEPDFMNQFVGVAADPNTIESDVSLISGATISSSAALGAIKQMLEYTSLAIEPHAGDKEALLAAQQAATSEDSSETGDAAGEAASGSANTYDVTGFAPFKVAVEVDADGKIVSVSVPENGETPGYGADLIADQSVFDALVGQDIATAQIDVKSGVTLTSNAINDALKQAADDYANGGSAAGGAKTYDVTGFAPFKVTVEVDADGKIVSVSVPENGETPGYGADLIADQSVFDALVGQDIATAQIDVKSGVTLTSNAINDALKQAADDYANGGAEQAPAVAGDPYTVKGMYKFTMYVEVEDGKIVSVSAPDNTETAGFGADILTDEALSVLVGQDIATAQIDVKSGVTMTSNAINEALRQAAVANGFEPAEATAAADAQPADDSVAVSATVSDDVPVYDVTGFAPFKVAVEVDADGKIVSVSVPENGETPGYGADLIADQSVFDALVGQDIATAQIDVKSGVTLTSNAINDALKQAAEAYASAAAEPEAEDAQDANADAQDAVVYDVTGFAPFKVAIAVDDAGKIVSVSVPEHSETAGFGADLIADQSVFDALVGQDIATAQIDVKSGVTLTSNAINDALKQAAASLLVVEEVEAESAPETEIAPVTEEEQPEEEVTVSESVEGTVYEAIVKGMSKHPLTLDITVDDSGKIVAATCVNQSEDEGYGADILTDEALSVLVGQDIATAKFDVKSGVTVTSNAINNALALIAQNVAAPAAEATAEAEPVGEAEATTGVYDVKGFAPFKVEITVDADGKIVSVSVPEHTETAGFGADLIADQSVFDALVGQDIATAQIDVKSGVTLTSNAINDALAQAAEEVQ